MKKINEIHKKNANVKEAILLGLVMTVGISYLSLEVLQLNLITYMKPDKLIEVILLIPSVFIVFFIHELIHVFFFLLFGKGKAKIKISRERSIGAVVMHQINEEVFYTRMQMVIILVSPLVLLTVILLCLQVVLPFSYLLFFNILLNTLGSTVDIYVTYHLLFKYSSSILINFDKSAISMNIYEK